MRLSDMAAVRNNRRRKSRKMPIVSLSRLSAQVQILCLLLLIVISDNIVFTIKKLRGRKSYPDWVRKTCNNLSSDTYLGKFIDLQ